LTGRALDVSLSLQTASVLIFETGQY
jgi:hypothetical protein